MHLLHILKTSVHTVLGFCLFMTVLCFVCFQVTSPPRWRQWRVITSWRGDGNPWPRYLALAAPVPPFRPPTCCSSSEGCPRVPAMPWKPSVWKRPSDTHTNENNYTNPHMLYFPECKLCKYTHTLAYWRQADVCLWQISSDFPLRERISFILWIVETIYWSLDSVPHLWTEEFWIGDLRQAKIFKYIINLTILNIVNIFINIYIYIYIVYNYIDIYR